MATVVSVQSVDPDITVLFKKSELQKWLSYAESYAESKALGTDWFLANMIGGILEEAEKR